MRAPVVAVLNERKGKHKKRGLDHSLTQKKMALLSSLVPLQGIEPQTQNKMIEDELKIKIGIRGWGAVSENNFLSWGASKERRMNHSCFLFPAAPAVRTNE